MLERVELRDKSVRLKPSQMSRKRVHALLDELNVQYVGTVVHSLGVVLSVLTLTHFHGGEVHQGRDGSALYVANFVALIFCPAQGETLEGRICHSNESGLRVSLGFFSDIVVPVDGLPAPRQYNSNDAVWSWLPEGDGGARLPMTLGDDVRLMVDSVTFPEHPESPNEVGKLDPNYGGTPSGAFAHMVVIATVNDDGLGCTSWWQYA
jgi:DNA-directed RNA polymerase III subunit RPC8